MILAGAGFGIVGVGEDAVEHPRGHELNGGAIFEERNGDILEGRAERGDGCGSERSRDGGRLTLDS